MNKIIIFCDGACSGNGKEDNLGGWGAVLKYKDQTKELFGGACLTTNNIMELTAAIEGLKAIKTKNIPVDIYSDSAYVVNCFTNGWYQKWRLNGWMTSKKEPVENKALWESLIELVESFEKLSFYKIKGHLDASKKADVKKWLTKFNQDNGKQLAESDFLELITLNHLADKLANDGIQSIK